MQTRGRCNLDNLGLNPNIAHVSIAFQIDRISDVGSLLVACTKVGVARYGK